MRGDLHVHSTASDGTLSPADLVALALERGLRVLAITDHDSVEGVDEALAAAEGTGLLVIPALELSAAQGGHDVHMLGYFVDHHDPVLRQRLSELREARLARARAMVDQLNDAGFDVSITDVLALAEGGAVGRSHVARALVDAGHAEDIKDAFRRLIGRGKPFYVGKEARSAIEAIEIIRAAGGLPVVAHPGVSKDDDILDELVAAGLAGIEAYHADHTSEQREHYARVARHHGLLVTGGTDFHGASAPNPALGDVALPPEALAAFVAFGRNRAGA
jgi:hypothetical protein